MRERTIYGKKVCYQTRRYGKRAVFYWILEIDGKDYQGDPFPDRGSFMDYIRNHQLKK